MSQFVEKPDAVKELAPEQVKAESLVRYREGAEKLLLAESTQPIPNGIPEHAAILFELFFRYAKRTVRIFCRNLDARVFDNKELVEAARAAIDGRSINVQVMVQEKPDDSAFYRFLKQRGIEVIFAPPEFNQTKQNFTIMDDKAIRIESDKDDFPKAKAYMFNPALATAWARFYDTMRILAGIEESLPKGVRPAS